MRIRGVLLGVLLISLLVDANSRQPSELQPNVFFQQDPQMRLEEVRNKGELSAGQRISLSDYSIGVNANGLFTINLQQNEMISVSSGGSMSLNANVFVGGDINVGGDIVVGGTSQWRLVRSDIFTDPALSTEWLYGTYLTCPAFSLITSTQGKSITYTYMNLPPHTQIQIQATLHFIDDWQGETGYLKIDDEYVWTKSHDNNNVGHKISVCGSVDFGESEFSLPIDVAFWNTNDQIKVEFGSTLESSVTGYLGLSSINLYIRESTAFSSGGSTDPNKSDIDPSYQTDINNGENVSPFADSPISSTGGGGDNQSPKHKKKHKD